LRFLLIGKVEGFFVLIATCYAGVSLQNGMEQSENEGWRMTQAIRFIFLFVILSLVIPGFIARQDVRAANNMRQPVKKQYVVKVPAKYPSSSSDHHSHKVARHKKTLHGETEKPIISDFSKICHYKPEELVRIDFSGDGFQLAGATDTNLTDTMPVSVVPCDKTSCTTGLMRFFMNTDVKAEKDIARALVHFYSRKPGFIWSDGKEVNERAKAVLAYFARAGENGLDPAEYMPDLPDRALEEDMRLNALASFEIALSARVLRYISDARGGRMIADRLSAYHDLPRKPVAFDEVLTKIHDSDNPAKMLDLYHPRSKWYRELKSELAALGDIKSPASLSIQPDILIHPGETNAGLPEIIHLLATRTSPGFLEKFHRTLEKHRDTTIYDAELEPVIRAYQKLTGKVADGVIGPATVAVLQGETVDVRRRRILYAMERLRWLPHDFSDRYVFINQPAFEAQYFENGTEKLAMKVIVGSRRYPTNFFYDTIRLVVFSPYWGVPRSIVVNEMIPRILADPSYLRRNGYEVYNNEGKRVNPYSVNWRRVAKAGGVNIRQKPGRANALGELKIMFPNKHNIYLHDTPVKAAFTREMRAISHGCVRLARPREMAAALMGVERKALEPYFGKNERAVILKETVPVYLVYFTAWPDATTHEIKYYDDIYGLDSVMQQADEKIHQSRCRDEAIRQAG